MGLLNDYENLNLTNPIVAERPYVYSICLDILTSLSSIIIIMDINMRDAMVSVLPFQYNLKVD